MSMEQYQRSVNSLDKEISTLEKKKSDLDKDCANLQSKIASAEKSIKSTRSAATVKSKTQQIERWTKEYNKKYGSSADLGKKISDKKNKRNEVYRKLQKEQEKVLKKQDEAMRELERSYEQRIEELKRNVISQETHLTESDDTEEYDVFVSHAWEDKESFVDEFVQCLRDKGIKVWYDTTQIKWGDSMREKIDDGLKKSTFGVVILSPNYIAEGKYWTKTELDGLFQLDSINGKVLLPIWHNLTKKEVMDYSPIVASKLALSTALLMPDEIAEEMKNLIENKSEESD